MGMKITNRLTRLYAALVDLFVGHRPISQQELAEELGKEPGPRKPWEYLEKAQAPESDAVAEARRWVERMEQAGRPRVAPPCPAWGKDVAARRALEQHENDKMRYAMDHLRAHPPMRVRVDGAGKLLEPVPEVSDDWQPIATSPRDGTPVMVYGRGRQTVAAWDRGNWFIEVVGLRAPVGLRQSCSCVTHWKPLGPDPRQTASEASPAAKTPITDAWEQRIKGYTPPEPYRD